MYLDVGDLKVKKCNVRNIPNQVFAIIFNEREISFCINFISSVKTSVSVNRF